MTKSTGKLPQRRFWTGRELQLLRELYPDHVAEGVATVIGRPVKSIYQKAFALGLQKSAAFLASDKAQRIRRGMQHPNMVASRFQPGLQPWNKGTRFVAGGRSAQTRFKPGRPVHEAHNYVPVGTLRISKDGYLKRKMTDDLSILAVRRWTAVHRVEWEANHGPIPAGFIVVFKPGMKTSIVEEITVDRLECISRAENARRNHPRNKSPELAKLVQLKGQITRQVNRINREAREAQGATV